MSSEPSQTSTPTMLRRAMALVAAGVVAVALFTGDHDGATAGIGAPGDAASVPVMQRDLAALGDMLHLPGSARDARFIVRPVGGGGALADSFVLEAWVAFPADGWDEVQASWGTPLAHPQAGRIQGAHADAMVPGQVRGQLQTDGAGDYLTKGLHYPAAGLGRFPWRVVQVVRVGDGGVLITAERQ